MPLPFFLTGQPKLDHSFYFLLLPAMEFFRSISKSNSFENKLGTLHMDKDFDIVRLIYVSQLCKSIQLPPDELEIQDIKMGCITLPVVKGIKTPSFTCTYMEDDFNSVYNTFHKWLKYTRRDKSFSFYPLYNISLIGMYIPTKSIQIHGTNKMLDAAYARLATLKAGPLDLSLASVAFNLLTSFHVPTGSYVYPAIYPSVVKRSQPDKGESKQATVEVTFNRVSILEGNSLINYRKWAPSKENKEGRGAKTGYELNTLSELDIAIANYKGGD